jgi:hypothetical protein
MSAIFRPLNTRGFPQNREDNREFEKFFGDFDASHRDAKSKFTINNNALPRLFDGKREIYLPGSPHPVIA